MAYAYNLKILISGKHVEVYKYKKRVWRDFQRDEIAFIIPVQLNLFQTKKSQKQKTKESLNRARTQIRRLVNSNTQLNKFLTLTFAKNVSDLKKANYIFNQFIKRISYQYPNFEYLAVPEFQKRGAVHYHLLCKLPYIKVSELEKIWGQGFIKINRINDIENVGAYICKYLNKDMFDERTFRKKKFFRCQTLTEPVEITGYQATMFIEKFLFSLKPIFEMYFESEWIGEVEYKAYLLDFEPFDKGFNRRILR